MNNMVLCFKCKRTVDSSSQSKIVRKMKRLHPGIKYEYIDYCLDCIKKYKIVDDNYGDFKWNP